MLMLILGCASALVCEIGWFSFIIRVFLIRFLFIVDSLRVFNFSHLRDWLFRFNFSRRLVLLRLWIVGLIVLASTSVNKLNNFSRMFIKARAVLLISLVFSFSFQDFIGFYFRFEVSLLPTLLLVLGWGYQPERVQAGVYILFYTLFGSIPLLVFLITIFKESGSSFILNRLYTQIRGLGV